MFPYTELFDWITTEFQYKLYRRSLFKINHIHTVHMLFKRNSEEIKYTFQHFKIQIWIAFYYWKYWNAYDASKMTLTII